MIFSSLNILDIHPVTNFQVFWYYFLLGRLFQLEDDRKAREQVDRVFKKLDLNQDGVITIEEFIESCLKVGISKAFILK
jgi:hypothetical protein